MQWNTRLKKEDEFYQNKQKNPLMNKVNNIKNDIRNIKDNMLLVTDKNIAIQAKPNLFNNSSTIQQPIKPPKAKKDILSVLSGWGDANASNPTQKPIPNYNHNTENNISNKVSFKDKYNSKFNPMPKMQKQAQDDDDIKSIASRLSKFTNRSKKSTRSKRTNKSVAEPHRHLNNDNKSEHQSVMDLKHVRNISVNGDETLNADQRGENDDEECSEYTDVTTTTTREKCDMLEKQLQEEELNRRKLEEEVNSLKLFIYDVMGKNDDGKK